MGSGQLVCWSVLYKFLLQGYIALSGRSLEYKVHIYIYIYISLQFRKLVVLSSLQIPNLGQENEKAQGDYLVLPERTHWLCIAIE